MCRMLLGKRDSIIRYNKKYNIVTLLDHLVDELGGDGNGLVLIQDKRIIYNKKGVLFSTDEISEILLNTDYDYCIFHTRLASIGAITDNNCHPFVFNNNCICMNGTIEKYLVYANKYDMTDTEYLFNKIKDINNINEVIKILQKEIPAFIGSVNGIPYIVKNLNTISRWKSKKDDLLFASSFTKLEKSNEIEIINDNNFYWYEGDMNV